MVKHKQAQETKSKVKLYKTKRGWFSALTRFFGLFSFMSKKEVHPIDLNDLDALKDADTSDNYKKGIATVATLFGMGAIGAVSPTEVHAATTTVGYSSQVIGSGSTSVSTSTSQSMASTSGSTASQSTSTSSVSQSMQSNSLSVNSVSGSTTSTTIFEGTTTSSMVTENSSNSISGSQAIENSDAASIDHSGSHSNSTTVDSITGSTSLDNEKTSIEESASTSHLEENGMATILPATGNNDGETSVANRTVTEGNIVQLAENIEEVSNEEELKAALQDASITTIKLKNNITLNNAITINNGNRNITIIGDGHYINALNSDGGIILNNSSGSAKIDLTIENATLYNTSKYGFVNMSSNGADTVTYKDVTAYGGTLVWSKTYAGVKTLNLVGNTTLNSVKSYEVDGQSCGTEAFSHRTPDGDKTTALYVSHAINIADNANVVLNNSATDIDMWLLTAVSSSSTPSTVKVGNNASLTMENIGNTEYNIKLDGGLNNHFIVNENAAVKMSAKVDNVRIIPQLENILTRGNIDLAKGSNVHLEVITGSNFRVAGTVANKIDFNGTATLIKQEGASGPTIYDKNSQANIEFNWLGIGGNEVNFKPGADVTLIAGKGASNIGSSSAVTAIVNINDPLRVAFNTDKLETDNGVTYLGNSRITVNVKNATIKVDDNDFSELISSNKTNINGSSVGVGSVSLNSNSTSYANESESLSASLSFSVATSMAASQLAAVNNGSQVIYGGSTSIYNSQSMSSSLSLSTSASLSESLSNSVSMSESMSNSVSISESLSNSVSVSESLSNSASMSESLSNSVSMSESLSNSVSMSESMSNSVSMSESLSNSVSMSESLSNSVSMSESLSNSVSMSESLSNSVSMSESLSNSVSMSESLSNSVSMSESMSNSVSMSESLSNSVSMSESLSNSVSMSESLSNSVSMSESLSNSVSMSESLSNSVSMSESLSNSVSMSESMSNSVSMSESLSNSVSMSESLSNSVSMSESLSNSQSMSISISELISLSSSESASTSLSLSNSTSISISSSGNASESLSDSLSSISSSSSLSGSTSAVSDLGSTFSDNSINYSTSSSLSIMNNGNGLKTTNISESGNQTIMNLNETNSVNSQKPSQQNEKLPQTGNEKHSTAKLLSLISLEAILLLLISKKKKG
ncbi:MAG: serine-rich glycoprotein adhesin [Limosilactobacillus reuteri]|nr:serine-rich glycoprotein adhesin [Limosilactobacillus reuteri]